MEGIVCVEIAIAILPRPMVWCLLPQARCRAMRLMGIHIPPRPNRTATAKVQGTALIATTRARATTGIRTHLPVGAWSLVSTNLEGTTTRPPIPGGGAAGAGAGAITESKSKNWKDDLSHDAVMELSMMGRITGGHTIYR